MPIVFSLIDVAFTSSEWPAVSLRAAVDMVLDYFMLAGVIPGVILVMRGRASSSSGQIIAGCALVSLATSTLALSVLWEYRDVEPFRSTVVLSVGLLSLAAIPTGLLLLLIPTKRYGPTPAATRGYLLSGGAILTLVILRSLGILYPFGRLPEHLIGGFIGSVLVVAGLIAWRSTRAGNPRAPTVASKGPTAMTAVALAVVALCGVVLTAVITHWHTNQVELPFTGLNRPGGVAVDTAGNIYVTDEGSNRVLKLPAGASTAVELPFTGLNVPSDVRVDTAGNVYVTDGRNGRVLVLAAGSNTASSVQLTNHLDSPCGVAVDAARNLYISDAKNNVVLYLPFSATEATALPFTGLDSPGDVAVDNSGNVFVTDSKNNRVLKLAAGGTSQTTLLDGLNHPDDLAVDGVGNVYITEPRNHRVLKLATGATAAASLPFAGLDYPVGVAVDNFGGVYITDKGDNRVLKLLAQ
jgi:serine/threonine-protein kinase